MGVQWDLNLGYSDSILKSLSLHQNSIVKIRVESIYILTDENNSMKF